MKNGIKLFCMSGTNLKTWKSSRSMQK